MANKLEDVQNHATFSLRDQLADKLGELKNTQHSLPNEVHDRYEALVRLLLSRISESDPIFIPTAALDRVHPQMQNAVNETNNFISNGNIRHLYSAIAHVSDAIAGFGATYRIETLSSGEDLISSLSNRSREEIASVKAQAKAASTIAEQVSTALTQLQQAIELEKERISSGLGNVERQFTESQSTRSTAFNDAMNSFDAQIRQALVEARDKLEEFVSTNSVAAEDRLGEIVSELEGTRQDSELKHKEILSLYGLVGRDSQIGGYKEAAVSATKAANVWDQVTYTFMVIAILALVGPSIVSYFKSGFTEIKWLEVLARFPLSSVLLLPAGYAAAQARRQKRIADTARRNQLHIAALGPYLSTLPEPTQHRIRAILTPRFFYVENPESLDVQQLFQQIEKLEGGSQ